jgi:hypothetical protein
MKKSLLYLFTLLCIYGPQVPDDYPPKPPKGPNGPDETK